jgi:outer membrane receptor protein involved in Fe transport
MQNNTLKTAILAALIGLNTPVALHAELNTALPGEQEESFALPLNIDLPAQPLAAALRQFAIQSNLSLTVDSALIVDKKAPAVKGRMTRKEAIRRLLDGSGLQGKVEGEKILIQRAVKAEAKDIQLDKVEVRAKRFYEIGPLPGLGLTKEEIPGNVQSISAKEIKESHSLSMTDLMNKKLQSVNVNDYAGNPFQMDVTYRGFTAGPQIGTPQGLSVFFDGIRVNEPFGDVVNWDMIPMNALASVDVFPGSNPIFGLNTLGGAFTVKTKDGFNNAGLDADVLTGSYGRKQLQVSSGWNNGTIGLFGAGNFFLEDGWRVNSPSKVNQFFGKASYRGEKLDLNLSTLLVKTELTGNGLLPSEQYAQDRKSVFTSPDTTDNTLGQFQLSGNYFVNDNFTVTGQVYHRKSDRHAIGAEVFTDYKEGLLTQRIRGAGEEATCLLAESPVTKGVPLYYVVPVAADASGFADITATGFYQNISDNYSSNPAQDGRYYVDPTSIDPDSGQPFSSFSNTTLPEEMAALIRQTIAFNKNYNEGIVYNRNIFNPNGTVDIPPITDTSGNPILDFDGKPVKSFDYGWRETLGVRSYLGGDPAGSNVSSLSLANGDMYFYTPDPANPGGYIKNFVILATPTNNAACTADRVAIDAYRAAGLERSIDGAISVGTNGQLGVVEGTPTGIINDNKINQMVDGASVQFNWNFENHKFMFGASIDAARAEYSNASQLGFLTAEHAVYLDPAQAHPMFIGATAPINNNDFSGTNTTKSVYFSETWSPTKSWNLNVSGRYNVTQTKNKVATRYGGFNYGIGDLISYPDDFNVCDGDCSVNRPLTNFKPYLGFETLDPAETEKFSFHSFNPSIGTTWQATERLNMFANVAQGARTPSVIELGCAFDKTPVPGPGNTFVAKSIAENRQCRLPTALSGDPYLPQIRSTSYDIGMRGTLKNMLGAEDLNWNVGAYQTDLKDDIYFVSIADGQGLFDTIGRTRRRGIEAGLTGRMDNWGFRINYSLTDATFEDRFRMISNDNSSATVLNDGLGRAITVKPGSRMPGVPLHNLNATISYDFTPKWRVGITAIAHSESFVRGNENNEHQKGALILGRENIGNAGNAKLQPAGNPGTVPGYATFNLQTSYKFNSEWSATILVNNLFDREYFTAGRLGRNPFSPSINGAIGPDGYNHNSNDWRSTNFISPGAPRGIWFSLNYQFDPQRYLGSQALGSE